MLWVLVGLSYGYIAGGWFVFDGGAVGVACGETSCGLV